MHAGFLILLWIAVVGALQFLRPDLLVAVVAVLAAIALWVARARTLRLLRRVRILLVAIVVLFAGFTPGEAVLADWPALSPSREGLLLALEHAGRLVAVVFCVAILLQKLSTDRLVGGLYALSRPFALVGLSSERVAVRMLLVLRYVDDPQGRGWRHWLDDEVEAPAETLHLQRERLGTVERVLLVTALLTLAWWYAR
ncbi:CbiQ family ECF transporter T component [Pseudothauera rhizosphaerae]|uniref:Cobalt transport protein n=1 Tax=Pseudothauera rhizosphaerae TaxID=2565932 RepID=A0A4S4ARP0_9RHOO|nr:CbiQ family ECF transporter T component [Pseudothauera rhizosphaerae]THF62481.1 hypothetical protein E6O51_05785 [Pseudothauera rhizosphaerae]